MVLSLPAIGTDHNQWGTKLNDWLEAAQSGVYNVLHYGAVGNGTTDDTAAIQAAWEDAQVSLSASPAFTGATGTLYFPPGKYVYTGDGLDFDGANTSLRIMGAGRELTLIELGASSYLVNITSAVIEHGSISDLQTIGGKGLFRHARTSTNVQGPLMFRNLELVNYTECGIGAMSSDYPYWLVENVIFRGDEDTAIGVAHAGDASGSVIAHCAFDSNRYHLKLADAGFGWRVEENAFIRLSRPDSGVLTDIWVVPAVASANAGRGFCVQGNKFGSENLLDNDFRVLFADEAAGTDFLTKDHSASASTGYVARHLFTHNSIDRNSNALNVPLVYSTTDLIFGCRYGDCAGEVNTILSLLSGTSADRVNDTNVWGPIANYATGREDAVTSDPVPAGYGPFLDFGDSQQGVTGAVRSGHSGADIGYALVLSTAMGSYSTVSAAITGSQASAEGRADAIDVDYSAAGGYIYTGFTPNAAGVPHWIEFDLKAAVAAALEHCYVGVWGGPTPTYFQRVVAVPAAWRHFRFLFIPIVGTAINLVFYPTAAQYEAGVTDRVMIGNARIYAAREPVNVGPIHLGTSAARIYTGAGSPESVQTAVVGSLYLRIDGSTSTTLYVKTSGTGNTGWTAK